jgi:NAD dependent epimerase/dehydratase family
MRVTVKGREVLRHERKLLDWHTNYSLELLQDLSFTVTLVSLRYLRSASELSSGEKPQPFLYAPFNRQIQRIYQPARESALEPANWAVFGHNSSLTEETIPTPIAAHGKAKLAGENLCREYARNGLDVTIVRPHTIVGHGRLGIFQILSSGFSKTRTSRYSMRHAGTGSQVESLPMWPIVAAMNLSSRMGNLPVRRPLRVA